MSNPRTICWIIFFTYTNILKQTWQQTVKKPAVDPEIDMNSCQLIRHAGYVCEEHNVTTADGFILTMQRIPSTRPGVIPVFLQHGLLASSTCWLSNLPNQSLAYILASRGYDVWLGNSRGNTYGRHHLKYNTKQWQFWAWSWNYMAEYDLPASIDFILIFTGHKQLYYVGHSQGTTIAFAKFSSDQEFSKKIKTFFALAPVTTVGNITSPIRNLAPYVNDLQTAAILLGWHDFLPDTYLNNILAKEVCSRKYLDDVCESAFFLISGYDPTYLNKTRLPVYIAHTPSGTSSRNVIHWAQMVNSDKFQAFDYGSWLMNFFYYGQITPPTYDPKRLNVPTVIFWAGRDALADPTDVKKLLSKIGHTVVANYYTPDYAHVDYIWATNANSRVYSKILNII